MRRCAQQKLIYYRWPRDYYINKMSSFEAPYASTIGLAFWVGGLALSPFASFFMRSYSQSLLIVQLVYLFGNVYAAGQSLFAGNLKQSFLGFIPSILTYCPAQSTYECSNSSQLTALVVWAAFTVLLWIIVKIVSIKKQNASFKPLYNFFKGLFRWTIVPVAYSSFNTFIISLQNQDYKRDYYGAITILIFIGLVILVELIAYKCTEEEDEYSWTKWLEFLSQLRVGVIVLLISLSVYSASMAKYFLYGPIVLYDIFHIAKYNNSFRIVERIIFILQQGVLITIYSMFIFDRGSVKQYSLDFVAAAVIILFELFQLIIRIYSYCKLHGSSGMVKNEDSETPEKNKSSLSKERSTRAPPLSKQNSYDSLAELKDGDSSPRRRGRGKLV